MLRVGLTGGLGSGKSTVGQMFSELGAHVSSADEIGRRLMAPGLPVFTSIVAAFGTSILSPDGSLNRSALADLAFRHGQSDALNRIVHPAVIAAEEEWMRGIFAAEPEAVAIIESALIFEAERGGTAPGWTSRFDKLILVAAPDELKVRRFVQRALAAAGAPRDKAVCDGFMQDARARLAAQIPDSEKRTRCHYLIVNDSSLEQLQESVHEIYRDLARLSRSKLPEERSKSHQKEARL